MHNGHRFSKNLPFAMALCTEKILRSLVNFRERAHNQFDSKSRARLIDSIDTHFPEVAQTCRGHLALAFSCNDRYITCVVGRFIAPRNLHAASRSKELKAKETGPILQISTNISESPPRRWTSRIVAAALRISADGGRNFFVIVVLKRPALLRGLPLLHAPIPNER